MLRVQNLDDDTKSEKELESKWHPFIKSPSFNNIDNFHFYKIYLYVKSWLNDEKTRL